MVWMQTVIFRPNDGHDYANKLHGALAINLPAMSSHHQL
jgi:hypothetical protein